MVLGNKDRRYSNEILLLRIKTDKNFILKNTLVNFAEEHRIKFIPYVELGSI